MEPHSSTLPADQSTSALAELAETLEGLVDRLGHTVERAVESADRSESQEAIQGISWICSALRGMALLFSREQSDSLVRQEEQLREIIASISGSVNKLSESNRGVAVELHRHKDTINRVLQLPPGQELAQRLLFTVDSLRGTTDTIEVHVDEVHSELGSAGDRIVELEHEINDTIEKARYDGLTRVYGREALDEHLADAVARGTTEGPWCFAIADIDRFKLINDEFGHVIGDAVLFNLARVIEAVLSEQAVECVFGRYGGEEFGIIIPSSTIVEGGQIAEWTRQQIEESRWAVREMDHGFVSPTISIGVAQYQEGEAVKELIERSDRALYRAKREGRNRVALARD